MNLGGKQDLDALLKSWPAPLRKRDAATNEQDEEHDWEERADAIMRAALAEKKERASGDAADMLLAAPALAPEPGEDAGPPVIMAAAGEKKMSQEKEPLDSAASTATPLPVERKRTSLKEIAARASQSGRPEPPGAATPLPSSVASPSRATSSPLARPTEAGKDDSGVINLNVVKATVTAQQIAAAEKAKPASSGLFEDDKPAEPAGEVAAAKAAPVKAASVTVLAPKKSNTGAFAGVGIAVLGIAAAFAIMTRKPPAAPTSASVATEMATVQVAPATPPVVTAAPVAVAAAEAKPSASGEPDSKPADTAKVAVVAPAGAGTLAAPPAAADTTRVAAKVAPPPGKPGDLQSEMERAVGKDGAASKAEAGGPVPEPAAGSLKNQNIPEQPSQGAVAAAVGGVMGGAKGCVAGADDVSRANVTFSSSGAVTTVAVTGWAAAHGKSSCIQAALKGAKVGPFSKSSYTVGMTIRP